MHKTLSGRLEELKNKGKVQLGNPKSGPGHLRELFTTMFKSQFKHGFTKGGRNKSWSLTKVVARRAETVFYNQYKPSISKAFQGQFFAPCSFLKMSLTLVKICWLFQKIPFPRIFCLTSAAPFKYPVFVLRGRFDHFLEGHVVKSSVLTRKILVDRRSPKLLQHILKLYKKRPQHTMQHLM